jgi:hypothetical protein
MKGIICTAGLILLLTGVISAQTGNTYYGIGALANNTTGDYNSAFGYYALYSNTSGHNNTAYGCYALYFNTSGHNNTAYGCYALNDNTTGSYNTATGYDALYKNTAGICNTAYGFYTLYYNTTGNYNTATGNDALFKNTTGCYNTATGVQALSQNTTGYRNSAHGCYALRYNTTGYYNAAHGCYALHSNTTGYRNTATGYTALYSNTTGFRNTATGYGTLYSNTTGTYNTAYGYCAMNYSTTGGYNTAVGYLAGPSSSYPDLSNSTALGYYAQNTASNQVRIGNVFTNSIGGQVGWTTLSDARFKQDVQQDVLGLDFIKKLRPVSYKIDKHAFNAFIGATSSDEPIVNTSKASEYTTGFIAQEVEAVVRECGFTNFSGVDAPENERDYYGIRYSEFVVPLVKAVQELSDMVEKQQIQIEEQQKQIDVLLSRRDNQKSDETMGSAKTEGKEVALLPREYSLGQNYPNPFAGKTSIKFSLPRSCDVELIVYNILGQKVTTLVSGTLAAGYHSITWDAAGVSAGTYFYELHAGDFISKKKTLMLK